MYFNSTCPFLSRVSGEVDKNRKLIDEINNLQRKIVQLEAELQGGANLNTEIPTDSTSPQRTVENLRRENEILKKRYLESVLQLISQSGCSDICIANQNVYLFKQL